MQTVLLIIGSGMSTKIVSKETETETHVQFEDLSTTSTYSFDFIISDVTSPNSDWNNER